MCSDQPLTVHSRTGLSLLHKIGKLCTTDKFVFVADLYCVPQTILSLLQIYTVYHRQVCLCCIILTRCVPLTGLFLLHKMHQLGAVDMVIFVI